MCNNCQNDSFKRVSVNRRIAVSETSPGRVVFFGLNITDNIKSAGFAFPGDPSVNLRMTDCLITVMLSVSAPRQVATSPASTGEHTPGRVVFFGVYTKNEKAEMRDFLSHFGFNRISNLFMNYII